MEHVYKGYVLVKNGTKEMPWNIYKMVYSTFHCRSVRKHVGFEKTLKSCKVLIDKYGV